MPRFHGRKQMKNWAIWTLRRLRLIDGIRSTETDILLNSRKRGPA
jgi:hypothetical protein